MKSKRTKPSAAVRKSKHSIVPKRPKTGTLRQKIKKQIERFSRQNASPKIALLFRNYRSN